MYILGISAFYHDSAACLIKNGEIVAAVQEERFTREKGDSSFPANSIEYCLREAGIDLSRVDGVAFYERPLLKFERILESFLKNSPNKNDSFNNAMLVWSNEKLELRREIEDHLGSQFNGKFYFQGHHETHAASAFFPSPYEHAAILTLDAVGEWSTSCIGSGSGNTIELLKEMRYPDSIGMLYSAFTYYTGFKVNSGEYKLMGLAPYGKPEYSDMIKEHIVEIHEDGSITLNMDYFDFDKGGAVTSEKFHQLLGGSPRKPESMITQKEMDLAASVQKVTEEIILRSAVHAKNVTGQKNLVMAGGVALNCVANGKILREGPFENIWIQPAAGDAGGSLGAALLTWHHDHKKKRVIQKPDGQKGSYLGPSFDNESIRLCLDAFGAIYEEMESEDELLTKVAMMMSEEKIIGWFDGRMEFGPRALGARSIIGDARSTKMQQVMNLKIKFRESFRPFAPCVLREHAHELFEMDESVDSPYMLLVAQIREHLKTKLTPEQQEAMKNPDLRVRVSVPRSSLPAITHVDYSARVQTVDEERNGRFYKLMSEFYRLTGSPVIVNTSFNIRGEPIVCKPEDAYRCFMATDMDCLVLGDFLLIKEDQAGSLLLDIEEYRNNIHLD